LTVILDAAALVAFAADEPAAGEVESLLRRGDVAITALNYGEALDAVARAARRPVEEVAELLAPIAGELLRIIDVNGSMAVRAAEIRASHYHGRRAPVSLADCVALAAATGGTIATSDRPLLRIAKAEAIEAAALPDSRGRRP
jgi:predicted nucleic acid-binding protein